MAIMGVQVTAMCVCVGGVSGGGGGGQGRSLKRKEVLDRLLE